MKPQRFPAPPIERVADNGMAKMCAVNSQLICPAGYRLELYQSPVAESCFNPHA
jgi:hypothetical protein